MTRILNYIVGILAFMPVSTLAAQDTSLLERMYDNVSVSCVEISYDYSFTMSGIKTVGQGILHAQGSLWHMEGNGIIMWCDSLTVWIADPASKEVLIEPAVEEEGDYLSNPALLFVDMDEVFTVQKARPTADGEAMLYILRPEKSCDISYCNIEINKGDASVRNAVFAMTDGNLLEIAVSSMTFSPKRLPASFRPSSPFDSSWIITDLR